MGKGLLVLLTFGFLATALAVPARQSASSVPFTPFEKWRQAVLAGNSTALASLYTQTPAPELSGAGNTPVSLSEELSFWSSWKSNGLIGLTAQIVQQSQPSPQIHTIVLQLALTTKQAGATKKQFVAMAQNWFLQGNDWHLGITRRTAATRLRQPLENKTIYPEGVDANAEIAETIHSASQSGKRILVVFGGNWCFDCHVLDEAFHSPEIAPTLHKSFLVVHVDVGRMDKNLDVAKKYDIPLDRGVPAVAVLDSNGNLLFSQKSGEFEAARSMAPEDILAFLNKWRPST